MRNNTKHFIYSFLFSCFLQEVIYANEYKKYTNKSVHTINLTMVETGVEKNTKLSFDKNDLRESFLPNFFKDIYSRSISNPCKESLLMYVNDFLNLEPWTIEMFDATGKPPSSLLLGTTTDFGSYDDCLKIKVYSEDESFLFKGQFCMLHLHHPFFQPTMFKTENGKDYVDAFGNPPEWIKDFVNEDAWKRFGLYLGICTPSVCTEEDIHSIINGLAEPTASNATITDCAVEKQNETKPFPLSAKFAIGLFSSVLILCVVGTSLDLLDINKPGTKHKNDENINRELLKKFSLYSNVKAVFAVHARKSPTDCMHGLRSVFCILVTVAHSVVYPTFWQFLRNRNFNNLHEILKPGLLMVLANDGLVLAEGFVFLSFFFLTYTPWRKVQQTNRNTGLWEIFAVRYWRFTPTHLFMIVISFMLPFISSGPVWDSAWKHEQEKCFRNGWKNILFLHNFDSVSDICWMHTWFIGVTFQAAIIVIPLMIVINKYPKFGIFLCIVMLFGSMAHTYSTSIKHGFLFCSINSLKIQERAMDFMDAIYIRIIFHIPSILLGLLCGWIVMKYKNQKLSKVRLITGWVFCTLCFAISLYTVYLPTTDHRIGALYNATRNTYFCLGLSWVVYACASGYGGVINEVLSWKAWVPISRISYSIYIVHPLFLTLRDGSLTERIYLDKIALIVEAVPYTLISIITGFIIFVAVENPCNNAYDLLKKKRMTSDPSSSLQPSTSDNKAEKEKNLLI